MRCTNYPNLFCYKTLHVSGTFSAQHQEFSTVHSALVSFMHVSDDRFQAESGWNADLFCYKTLHVSGIFSVLHQEFNTVHSAVVIFMQVSDDRFQVESGCFIPTLRSSKTCMKLTNAECTVENS